MKHIHFIILGTIILYSSFSMAQTGIYDSGGIPIKEQLAYDVLFYDLTLEVDPAKKWIGGSLAMTCEIVMPVNVIILQLDTLLRISKIEIDGEKVEWKRSEGLIFAYPGTLLFSESVITTEVFYSGKPKQSPDPQRRGWGDGFYWQETSNGQPWIDNVSVLDGADIWWPCKDHPSDEADSMAINITVPENLVVAANGRLRNVSDPVDNKRTYSWFISTPVNNYAVTINVAPFETVEQTYTSVTGEQFPFIFWSLPESKTNVERHFPNFMNEMRFLEETLGPYPFRADKYGIAETYYLGMETQSIIAYGSDYTLNEYGFDYLHFHELTHEWFANMVTAEDWKHWWIHEGITTYVESLYAEHLNGEEAYHRYVKEQYLPRIQNKQPIVKQQDFVSTREGYIGDVYAKGAAILHSLRYLLGKEKMLATLRKMAYPDPEMEKVTDGSHCRFSNTKEFKTIAESVYGVGLDWFFDAYLSYPEIPRLLVHQSGNQYTFTWNTPSFIVFEMPVQVMIGDKLETIKMEDGRNTFFADGKIEIDPQKWILMDVVQE